MIIVCSCLAALCVIFNLIFCFFRAKKATVFTLALKTIASVCFILCAIFAIFEAGKMQIGLLVLCGLIFGLIGDIILDLKVMHPEEGDQFFTFGTISFAIGHLFYLAATCLYAIEVIPDQVLWCALASLGVAVLLTLLTLLASKKMGLKFGKHLPLVAIYSLILSFMMSFSVAIAIFNPIFWIFAAGMIVFLLSDLVLSNQYFGAFSSPIWIYVNHTLYYIAQAMLAFSLIYIAIL